MISNLEIPTLNFFQIFNSLLYFFWPHGVFIAACGLSLVVESGGYFSLWCTGFWLRWLLLLWSMGPRALRLQPLLHKGLGTATWSLYSTGLIVSAHELSCSSACGVFPDQGSNPCPLHCKMDSCWGTFGVASRVPSTVLYFRMERGTSLDTL